MSCVEMPESRKEFCCLNRRLHVLIGHGYDQLTTIEIGADLTFKSCFFGFVSDGLSHVLDLDTISKRGAKHSVCNPYNIVY